MSIQDAVPVTSKSLLIRAVQEADKASKLLAEAEREMSYDRPKAEIRTSIAETRVKLMREYIHAAEAINTL